MLREALDVRCVDCQLGRPRHAREEEVGAWVCGEDGGGDEDDEEEECGRFSCFCVCVVVADEGGR